MAQLRTVTMLFDGLSVHITRPADAEYEEFLCAALEAFQIPINLKDFFQVLSGHKYLFGKEAFDRYVSLYPDCDFVFELRMKILSMNERVSNENGELVVKPILTEKRSLDFDLKTKSLISVEKFDEPTAKRVKRFELQM